jgi:NADPH:quinone reductase-like Zn-dependent oxidoreductase
MLDVAGNRSWSDCKRVLDERGTLVIVGGPKSNRLVGSLSRAVRVRLLSIPGSRRVAAPFLASLNRGDLVTLGELLEAGTVMPVIDRQYPLEEAAEALGYVAEGHARGKVVIDVAG